MRWGEVLLGGALAASIAGTAAAQDDGAAHEWNQPRGNAARTACVDVAPIRGAPQVAWRTDLPGPPVSSPVSWDGVVFVATRNAKGEGALTAVNAATGETIATRALGKVEWADVAVLRGNVVVVDPALTRCLRFDGRQFSLAWNMKGEWTGRPAISHGTLLLADATCVHVLDPASGRDVLPPVLLSSSGLPSDLAATCATDVKDGVVQFARLNDVTSVSTCVLSGLGTKKPSARSDALVESPFATAEQSPHDARAASLVQLGYRWLATCPSGFCAKTNTW